MPVTQKQIAECLGISQQVVGQALLGRKGMGENLRARILSTAREMGYEPHAAARSLRTGATHNVVFAYVRPWGVGAHRSVVATSIAEKLGDQGYRLETKCAPTNEALLESLENVVRARSADAFILWGDESDVEVQGAYLESAGLPFVARGYYDQTHPEWIQFDFDHRGMMRQNLDKLVELGHRRIALYNHVELATYSRNFRRAFDEIIQERFDAVTPSAWIITSQETVECQYRTAAQVDRWFRLPEEDRPTAMAVGEIGSMARILDMMIFSNGIRIGDNPGQFSIAGVAGYPTFHMMTGRTWVYDADAEARMIEAMLTHQLSPLLRKKEPQVRRLRHLPGLHECDPFPDIWRSPLLTNSRPHA